MTVYTITLLPRKLLALWTLLKLTLALTYIKYLLILNNNSYKKIYITFILVEFQWITYSLAQRTFTFISIWIMEKIIFTAFILSRYAFT